MTQRQIKTREDPGHRADTNASVFGSPSTGAPSRGSADCSTPEYLRSKIPVALAPVRPGKNPNRARLMAIGKEMFANGATCRAIAAVIGYKKSTIESSTTRWGWVRLRLHCTRCGCAVPPDQVRNKASLRVCHACTLALYREKSARYRADKERKQAERRRGAERKGKTYMTLEERKAAQKARQRIRTRSPYSELGRYRHYGEMPTTTAGLLLALRDTMTALLDERCAAAGITRETAQYRVWYAKDPAFRAKEKAKSAGRKAKRESTMKRDGTLTPDVIRRLFATSSMCPYCERLMHSTDKTLDHITPVSLGGVHGISNVTVCCYSCNSRKGNMTFDKWLTRIPPQIAARFRREHAA